MAGLSWSQPQQPCCVPDQWEGVQSSIIGEVKQGTGEVTRVSVGCLPVGGGGGGGGDGGGGDGHVLRRLDPLVHDLQDRLHQGAHTQGEQFSGGGGNGGGEEEEADVDDGDNDDDDGHVHHCHDPLLHELQDR